jgi:hypothetical protein
MEFESPFEKLERVTKLCEVRIKQIEETINKLKTILKGSMDSAKENK